MVYRKGELSKAMIDRDWPHQVALPAYRCIGHRYLTIQFFCEAQRLSFCTRRHLYRENDEALDEIARIEHALTLAAAADGHEGHLGIDELPERSGRSLALVRID